MERFYAQKAERRAVMALRALMLRKKIDEAKKKLETARSKAEGFQTREAELETAITEAETEEEKQTVEAEIDAFEKEKAANTEEVENLEKEVQNLEGELAAEEAKTQAPAAPAEPAAPAAPAARAKENKTMSKRTKFFGMSHEERSAFVERDDVKGFLTRVREMIGQKRAVNGGTLFIPTVVLDLIRENIDEFSKLSKHVFLRPVAGKARQPVSGAIPEGVWTEMCAALNELQINFYAREVDGYKVGGYVPVCNALLHDSDINLAQEVFYLIGAGIGIALDKAILYGKGVKMPLGILPRLEQTSDPQDDKSSIPWVDLHTTNILSYNTTGASLFADIITGAGNAKGKYTTGEKFWAMNNKTYTALMAAALTINAAGAVVSGMNKEMPVIGGAIEILDFMQDNVLIGGYGKAYLLAEREGAEFRQSEHVMFIQDHTVFVGEGRYDGAPIIAEAFVAIGIGNTTPASAGITFAGDTANDATLTSLALGTLTLTPTFDPATFEYATTLTASLTKAALVAVPSQDGADVTIEYNGKKWINGSEITFAATEKDAVVTVKKGMSTCVYTITITPYSA